MSTPTRFSDGQYKNWIKCSQSLIIMKEALHDYIDKEVKNLHSDIALKVSSIPCGSSTGNQCGSCSSKNIRLTGGKPGNWNINCKNSICDKWLQQILAVHDDPHNPNINWKNADIRKWPTDCYHVAKIFMPKGQDKTTKMPDDLDAPAILSLMKYCSWFRKDLPNTQILSDLIEIRNKVLHSGDLRVTDGDKDSWIDLMIQLLKDLMIPGDAQAKLETLKKEDIDINFRETEVRVLQKMVSGLVSDLTVVKVDITFLQKSQSDLSEGMENVKDSNTETTGKVDRVEADIEGISKSVEELKIIYDKMVLFFDKNPGILDQDITETIRVIDMDVKDLYSNLFRAEMELKARVSSLEKHREDTSVQIKGVERRVEGIEGTVEENKKQIEGIKRRVAAVEEQKKNDELLSLETETRRKKRPETEGLRQLKTLTEDRLDTQKKLECIPTKQAEEAKKLLADKRSIVIKGNPGEGKTTMSLHLIDNEMFIDKRVVLNHPRQWENVDTDWVSIVVLEDVFGQYDFDPGRLQEWMVHLPTIQDHVDAGKIQVIVTTRADVLSKANSKLGLVKLFSEELSLTLSSEKLTNSEKMSILNREINRHKRNMKEDEKEVCIANFGGLIGFPQCCSLFAGDSKSFDKGPEFFRSPTKFFLANITKLEATKFLHLAFLFCNGEILEENLSSETMAKSSKQLLMDLASHLNISKKQASITLLRDAYDNFLDLYIVKSMSYDLKLKPLVKKPCIRFTHATVSEAVGHVLWDRCPEMVVKYGDSEYLYQRTYTAEVKDDTSENMFIPVYAYGVLAERIVHDVVKKGHISSVVKHSALKNHDFLMKLKDELHKSKMMKDFFMAGNEYSNDKRLLEGKCQTFMQLILQSDEDVASLVYNGLLEFFKCDHNYVISDCWKCTEKQNLLQLSLYYHHFHIADKLITLNASYTQVSLCNAARHGDLQRVQTILETLNKNQVFNPKCEEAKYALCRAYISGNQSLIAFLLQEKIILDKWHVVHAVQHGDINVLKNVVEHLRYYNKWKPDRSQQWIPQNYSICVDLYFYELIDKGDHFTNTDFISRYYPWFAALFITYFNENFDMADYLIKNGINVEMTMLVGLLNFSSQPAAFRAIQDLKHTGTWDPKCDDASKALEAALCKQKYDVYDLLVQDRVSLKMKNLPRVIMTYKISLESVKKAIQHLKDTDNWDPKCDDASKALEAALCEQKYDVYDLLVQDGVSLKIKNLPRVIMTYKISLESVKKAIQHLKDTDNWDPKCDDASKALETAFCEHKYDVYDLLVQDQVSLKMENLPRVIMTYKISLESAKKAIQHLKDTDNWDPKCEDASKALEAAICEQKYNVYDLLVQDGVSLKMKNLPRVIRTSEISLESVKKAVQHMKDTDNWDPKCDDASVALRAAICEQKYDVYDLMVQDGVSLKMENLPCVIMTYKISLESVKKAIQHMKDSDNWDPKCGDASVALQIAFCGKKYDVYDLLVQNGVSLKMENLPCVIRTSEISLESLKKAIQHMKDTDNWDPKCDDASKALETALCKQKYDVYDLLVQNGISLKMETLPRVIMTSEISLESVKKAIQHMKDTDNWDPKCGYASVALQIAFCGKKYDVYDLLVQNGVSLKMENLPCVIRTSEISLESLKKPIQHMKDTDNWDPKCDDASKALETALCKQKYDVYDLLVQNGISLKMETLPRVIMTSEISLESVKKAIQHMKDTDNWDPKCGYASVALEIAFCGKKYDVYDLLVQNGVSLKMENLPCVIMTSEISLESLKKAIQHMKDTDNWDPKCRYVSEALETAICEQKYDVYNLLVQNGLTLKMNRLLSIIMESEDISLESLKKAIEHLKDTDNWDPTCDVASEALLFACRQEKYGVVDLLVQEGVLLNEESS